MYDPPKICVRFSSIFKLCTALWGFYLSKKQTMYKTYWSSSLILKRPPWKMRVKVRRKLISFSKRSSFAFPLFFSLSLTLFLASILGLGTRREWDRRIVIDWHHDRSRRVGVQAGCNCVHHSRDLHFLAKLNFDRIFNIYNIPLPNSTYFVWD